MKFEGRLIHIFDQVRRVQDRKDQPLLARMNRLFGVTMREKGVSQLVSVDLQAAERFQVAS